MYYTNGNYEAFARPRRPEGVEDKHAWLVGGGLASLAAAAFLIRDGGMEGSRIHILEEAELPGGACDGLLRPELYNKSIDEVLSDDFYASNFWLYWQTMFAFETWHSALEMKLYLQRFIHHIGGLPDLSALKFTKYNQYESLILPLVKYLEEQGVQFEYGVRVENVLFHFLPGKKVAHQMVLVRGGKRETKELTENDLVFVTNGSCTEESALGANDKAPVLDIAPGDGASWQLWKNIAVQNPAFGRPEKFCSDIEATKWESATVTLLDDRIAPYVERVCGRDPYAGKVVTGGIVTVKDSAWLMSWTFNRQPHFKAQPEGQLVGWIYGLYPD